MSTWGEGSKSVWGDALLSLSFWGEGSQCVFGASPVLRGFGVQRDKETILGHHKGEIRGQRGKQTVS